MALKHFDPAEDSREATFLAYEFLRRQPQEGLTLTAAELAAQTTLSPVFAFTMIHLGWDAWDRHQELGSFVGFAAFGLGTTPNARGNSSPGIEARSPSTT